MTDREAMKMALAKLEHLWEIGIDAEFKVELMPEIAALRQALAQPEQESISTNDHLCAMLRQVHDVLACTALPMKREWVGLTDEERNEMIGRIQHDQYTRQRDLINSTQIITEMYLKEKNGG